LWEMQFLEKSIVMDSKRPVQDLFVPLLVDIAGSHVEAIVLYGSHLSGTSPGRYSAYDLVLIVDQYRGFYDALYSAKIIHRSPFLMTIFSWFLPPTVIRLSPEGDAGALAKCLVIDRSDFERSLRVDRARDHFMISRMIQKVQVVYRKSDVVGEWVRENLQVVRYDVLSWATLWISQPFNSASLAREMLRICYRSENRPESSSRSDAIFLAQQKELVECYSEVLAEAEIKGELEREGDGYRTLLPASKIRRLQRLLYFKMSKLRVTFSWFKHMVTFEGWLPYIVRKVERRTGNQIHLTKIEKMLPVLFLWPRVLFVFWNRPEREAEPGQNLETATDQGES